MQGRTVSAVAAVPVTGPRLCVKRQVCRLHVRGCEGRDGRHRLWQAKQLPPLLCIMTAFIAIKAGLEQGQQAIQLQSVLTHA